jgi:hypothetical protein
MSQLFGYIGNAPWESVRNRPPHSYFNPLSGVLVRVLRELQTGGAQSRWPMDAAFERFAALLREDPQRFGAAFGQMFEATAHLLYHRSQFGGRSEAYRRFAEILTDGDLVLTFNWDVCLEIAMQRAGKPLERSLRPSGPGPWLFKLNGSIDYLIVRAPSRGEAAQSWTDFPFLEPLNARAPQLPGSKSHHELARLRTYDLAGYEMSVDSGPLAPIGEDAIANDVTDVGPFLLTHKLPEYPTTLMIGPATPAPLSNWYHNAIAAAMAPIVSRISRVYVVGYSFPVYDLAVMRLLRQIVQAADRPAVDIVNPDAARLPPQALQFVFGRTTPRLHASGFETFNWTS